MIALGLADAPESVVADGGAEAPARPRKQKPPVSQTDQSDPNFVEPDWFGALKYAMRRERGVSLFGPRGCGKSSAILELAARTQAEAIVLQCCANMQIDGLLGSWAAEGGSTRFIEGPLALAVRRGAWLVAEESNAIHPGVWSAVNTLTDQTGHGLRLPTGETIPPSKGFRLALLYNDGYAGTREVNAALKDRLMPIYAGYMGASAETVMLHNRTGAPAEICESVVRLGGMIRAAGLRMDLGPRAMIRLIRLVGLDGMSWTDAYRHAVLDLAGAPDQAAAQRTVLEELARQLSLEAWPAVALDDDDDDGETVSPTDQSEETDGDE